MDEEPKGQKIPTK